MNRWLWCVVCALAAESLILCGWLAPAHLRAIEPGILQRAGRQSTDLVGRGLLRVDQSNLGAAQWLDRAAQDERIEGREKLARAAGALADAHPDYLAWGGDASPRLAAILRDAKSQPEPLTDFLVRQDAREKAFGLLQSSSLPLIQALLRVRALTNTAIFPPSTSSAGQALDVAISVAGLLAEEGRLTPHLRESLLTSAAQAGRGDDPREVEEALLDFVSLGRRLNWGQLAALTEHVDDTQTLQRLAGAARRAGEQMPLLFSAVELSGRPGPVCEYLEHFSLTGLADLGASLQYGSGGVDELLRSDARIYVSNARQRLAARQPFAALLGASSDLFVRTPRLALLVKCGFYLAGGFALALSLHFARAVPELERPLRPPGFHVAREALFALGFVFVVLLLSEPFLAQDSQRMEIPFRLRLPAVGGAVPALIAGATKNAMNPVNLLTLLLFFVLQALLYVACLVKLAEIRHVNALPRVKLRLLENEDHLFDAGLYLGFVGTIISLILVSLGVIKPSLMAAYSSTSFGIIFVSIFKIFHLRPARRTMLLEAENQIDRVIATAPASALPSAT